MKKLTHFDFRAGCIEHHNDLALMRENGCYLVRGFAPDGTYLVQEFRRLDDARDYAKHHNIFNQQPTNEETK